MTQLNFRAIRSSLMVNNGLITGLALPITHYPVFFGVSGGLCNEKTCPGFLQNVFPCYIFCRMATIGKNKRLTFLD